MDVLHCGVEKPEDVIRNNQLKMVLVEAQEVSEVSRSLRCSKGASDVAVGVQ
jgi:hypothetical protein